MRKRSLTLRESKIVQEQVPQQIATTNEIADAIQDVTGEEPTQEDIDSISESLRKRGTRVIESKRRRFNQQQGQGKQNQQVIDEIVADQTITPQQIADKVQDVTGEEPTEQQVQEIAESLKRRGFSIKESGRSRRFNQQQGQRQQGSQQAQIVTTDEIADQIADVTGEEATQEDIDQIAESLKRRGCKIVESRKSGRSSRVNENSPIKIKKIKLFEAK